MAFSLAASHEVCLKISELEADCMCHPTEQLLFELLILNRIQAIYGRRLKNDIHGGWNPKSGLEIGTC